MTWFEGTHTETRTLNAPIASVREHFSNPATIVANTQKVESSSIEDGVIHFVLEEEDHQVMKFKADYKCKYEVDGNTVKWAPVGEGNLQQSGNIKLTEQGDETVLEYSETVKVEIGIPAMMAPMLKPVISAMLASEIKDFVKRMSALS